MRTSVVSLGSVGTFTMSLVVALLAASCSSDSGAPSPAGGGSANGGGVGAGGSAAGASAGGGPASTAGSTNGTSGTSGAAGTSATGGAAGTSTGGTSSGGAGGSGGAAGGPVGGAAGSGGGSSGAGGGGNCTPNAAGTFMVNGEVVFDPKTCLSWTKATIAGQPYAEAETYCGGLSLGGHDDWRLPTAGEVVSIFKCNGMQPPVADVFTVMGDGIWTTTLTGTIAGDQPKVCGAGQNSGQYYDFGKVGGQNTRCVRGATTLPDRTDCKTNTMICPK